MAGDILSRSERIKYKTPITLIDKRTGYQYSGTLHNYSKSGLYFESDYAQRPGRKICITSNNLPFKKHIDGHHAEVIWRKFLGRRHPTHPFGIGAKFC